MDNQTAKNAAIGLVITIVGTVAAAVIMKVAGLQDPPAVPVSQQSAIPSRLKVPKFEQTLETGEGCKTFEDFLGNNLGKLVEIHLAASAEFSSVYDSQDYKSLHFRSYRLDDDTAITGCIDMTCVIKGDASSLYWYKTGHNRLAGFFVIDPDVTWHQGEVFVLRAVTPESVLVHTQTAR